MTQTVCAVEVDAGQGLGDEARDRLVARTVRRGRRRCGCRRPTRCSCRHPAPRRDAAGKATAAGGAAWDRAAVPAPSAPRPPAAAGSRCTGAGPAAVRARPGAADHQPARPRRRAGARRRPAVRRPDDAAGEPGPLRHPAAARQRRPARRARRRRGRTARRAVARGVAAALRALAGLPRDAGALLARERAGRDLRRRAAARRATPPTPSTTGSPNAWPTRRSGRARCTDRFGIEVLATTDDPCDDLAAHEALRDDPGWSGRGRADLPSRPLPRSGRAGLAEPTSSGSARLSGVDTGDYDGYLAALEDRRRYFVDHGAVSTDHGVPDAGTAAARAGRGAGACTARRLHGELHPGAGRRRSAGTCWARWRGWPATTAWS